MAFSRNLTYFFSFYSALVTALFVGCVLVNGPVSTVGAVLLPRSGTDLTLRNDAGSRYHEKDGPSTMHPGHVISSSSLQLTALVVDHVHPTLAEPNLSHLESRSSGFDVSLSETIRRDQEAGDHKIAPTRTSPSTAEPALKTSTQKGSSVGTSRVEMANSERTSGSNTRTDKAHSDHQPQNDPTQPRRAEWTPTMPTATTSETTSGEATESPKSSHVQEIGGKGQDLSAGTANPQTTSAMVTSHKNVHNTESRDQSQTASTSTSTHPATKLQDSDSSAGESLEADTTTTPATFSTKSTGDKWSTEVERSTIATESFAGPTFTQESSSARDSKRTGAVAQNGNTHGSKHEAKPHHPTTSAAATSRNQRTFTTHETGTQEDKGETGKDGQNTDNESSHNDREGSTRLPNHTSVPPHTHGSSAPSTGNSNSGRSTPQFWQRTTSPLTTKPRAHHHSSTVTKSETFTTSRRGVQGTEPSGSSRTSPNNGESVEVGPGPLNQVESTPASASPVTSESSGGQVIGVPIGTSTGSSTPSATSTNTAATSSFVEATSAASGVTAAAQMTTATTIPTTTTSTSSTISSAVTSTQVAASTEVLTATETKITTQAAIFVPFAGITPSPQPEKSSNTVSQTTGSTEPAQTSSTPQPATTKPVQPETDADTVIVNDENNPAPSPSSQPSVTPAPQPVTPVEPQTTAVSPKPTPSEKGENAKNNGKDGTSATANSDFGNRKSGKGFAVGMGFLGAILLLLLLLCLFFSIFRGRQGSYYNSGSGTVTRSLPKSGRPRQLGPTQAAAARPRAEDNSESRLGNGMEYLDAELGNTHTSLDDNMGMPRPFGHGNASNRGMERSIAGAEEDGNLPPTLATVSGLDSSEMSFPYDPHQSSRPATHGPARIPKSTYRYDDDTIDESESHDPESRSYPNRPLRSPPIPPPLLTPEAQEVESRQTRSFPQGHPSPPPTIYRPSATHVDAQFDPLRRQFVHPPRTSPNHDADGTTDMYGSTFDAHQPRQPSDVSFEGHRSTTPPVSTEPESSGNQRRVFEAVAMFEAKDQVLQASPNRAVNLNNYVGDQRNKLMGSSDDAQSITSSVDTKEKSMMLKSLHEPNLKQRIGPGVASTRPTIYDEYHSPGAHTAYGKKCPLDRYFTDDERGARNGNDITVDENGSNPSYSGERVVDYSNGAKGAATIASSNEAPWPYFSDDEEESAVDGKMTDQQLQIRKGKGLDDSIYDTRKILGETDSSSFSSGNPESSNDDNVLPVHVARRSTIYSSSKKQKQFNEAAHVHVPRPDSGPIISYLRGRGKHVAVKGIEEGKSRRDGNVESLQGVVKASAEELRRRREPFVKQQAARISNETCDEDCRTTGSESTAHKGRDDITTVSSPIAWLRDSDGS